MVDNCIINFVEECIDLVVCIINDFDLNLIVWLLGMCEFVVVVVLLYLVVYGILCCVEDLVIYNCLMYLYFGKSLWKFMDVKMGVLLDVLVGGNLSVNELMVLLIVVWEGVGIVL